MRFTYQGTEYVYDDGRLDVEEARALKRHGDLTVSSFVVGMGTLDPDALTGMVFIGKRRAGEAVRWQDIGFDVFELANSMKPDEEPNEGQGEGKADGSRPTVPGVTTTPDGTSRNGASDATSPLSPISTASTPGTSTDSVSPSSTPTP